MRTRTDVIFYCWRCGTRIVLPESMQGKLTPCPRCERLITVPPEMDAPKQVVQLPDLEEDVAITENDITFDCVHCNYLLVADKRGIGMTVTCPGCGRPVKIPNPKKSLP